MQTWILYYIERLRDRMRIGHCSMDSAVQAELGNMDAPALFKLRGAAFELQTLIEVELGRRVDSELANLERHRMTPAATDLPRLTLACSAPDTLEHVGRQLVEAGELLGTIARELTEGLT